MHRVSLSLGTDRMWTSAVVECCESMGMIRKGFKTQVATADIRRVAAIDAPLLVHHFRQRPLMISW